MRLSRWSLTTRTLSTSSRHCTTFDDMAVATSTQTATAPEKLVLNVPPVDVKALMQKDGTCAALLGFRTVHLHTGFVVIPSVLSRQKAKHYADQAYSWVEKFGCGFDRNDPSTHTVDKLPYFVKGAR